MRTLHYIVDSNLDQTVIFFFSFFLISFQIWIKNTTLKTRNSRINNLGSVNWMKQTRYMIIQDYVFQKSNPRFISLMLLLQESLLSSGQPHEQHFAVLPIWLCIPSSVCSQQISPQNLQTRHQCCKTTISKVIFDATAF